MTFDVFARNNAQPELQFLQHFALLADGLKVSSYFLLPIALSLAAPVPTLRTVAPTVPLRDGLFRG